MATWIAHFERKGWFKNGKPVGGNALEGVGIAFEGGKDSFIGLSYVVEVTEDFLVVEYEYNPSTFAMLTMARGHTAGWSRLWIPWSSIKYAFENFERT